MGVIGGRSYIKQTRDMSKGWHTIYIICVVSLTTAVILLLSHNRRQRQDIGRLSYNNSLLLSSNASLRELNYEYKIRDSLNAVKTSALMLELSEYDTYRRRDLNTIRELNIKVRELEDIIAAQAVLQYDVQAPISDTIINMDTARVFNYVSEWSEVKGFIGKDTVTISIRDTVPLLIVETVRYKRFLGFLWKTRKVKRRQVDVTSENPNVIIDRLEFIHITK